MLTIELYLKISFIIRLFQSVFQFIFVKLKQRTTIIYHTFNYNRFIWNVL